MITEDEIGSGDKYSALSVPAELQRGSMRRGRRQYLDSI